MEDTEKKDIVKKALNAFIAEGIGGIMMIIGALVMIFYKKLNIEYPYWLIIGCVIMFTGLIVWVIFATINYLKWKKTNKESLGE